MIRLRINIISALLFSAVSAHAQNSDLLMNYNSGSFSGMGGTGIAPGEYLSSPDVNPASLAEVKNLTVSVSSDVKYYGYELSRISSTVGGEINNWDKTFFDLGGAEINLPLSSTIMVGAGLYRKISPRIINKKRAVTYSELFLQETSGSVYAAAVSACFNINKNFAAGITLYEYFGQISSRIKGDNHGRDSDKLAELNSRMKGRNLRAGLIFSSGNWSAGAAVETPFDMNVEVSKNITADNTYSYLFPSYNTTTWKQPFTAALGISYAGLKRWFFEADFEARYYKNSDVQLNLYEFGGTPVWNNVNIFRIGARYRTNPGHNFPILAGYAILPQLYYSNNSTGTGNVITSYYNTERNVRHLFTAGTEYNYESLSIDLNLAYSFVKWHRTLTAPQTLTDDFIEENFILKTGIKVIIK